MITIDRLTKSFQTDEGVMTILNELTFSVLKGEALAIIGPSGSGKTTLLSLCAGLERPNKGEISVCGRAICRMTEKELTVLRCQKIGFIFQEDRLLPMLTAQENIQVPLELLGIDQSREKARYWLDKIGLLKRANHLPSQLSGGEKQRISIARALIKEPDIIFADEPTGNLDFMTQRKVRDLFFSLLKEMKSTVVVVTHEPYLSRECDRVMELKEGSLTTLK